jgi:hypothetical protein
MALTLNQALIIACKSMNPFVVDKLLAKDPGGNTVATPTAPAVRINLALHDLDEDDRAYGLHSIHYILKSLDSYCQELQHQLLLTSAELLDGDNIEFVDDLATVVKARAKPV